MAYQTTITDWCLANQEHLNISVSILDWVKDWIPDFHDFEVEIRHEGISYKGRGTERNAKMALEKAHAEALERACCNGRGLQFHSAAVHFEKSKALEHAIAEFRERSFFFGKFLNWHDGERRRDWNVSDSLIDKIEAADFNLSTFIVIEDLYQLNVAVISSREHNQIFYGMSLGSKMEDKALVECLRSFVGYLVTGEKEEFIPYGKSTVSDIRNPKITVRDLPAFLKEAPIYLYVSEDPYLQLCLTERPI